MHKPSRDTLIDMQTLERVAPILRNAAHPLRLRIIDLLSRSAEPRAVGDIVEATGVEQAVVSQQLRILKDQGILWARREGHYVLYGIADPSILLLTECIRRHQNGTRC
jgi:DNA-binding transcriptional ArsR family regulator